MKILHWITKHERSLFAVWLLLFFAVVLINLDRIPVAWLDETFGLDPAINLIREGSYTSKIWPHPGTEYKFLAYMPFIQFYNAAFLTFLPAEIFWVRLPYILAFVIVLIFLWKIYRKALPFPLSYGVSALLLFIFMNDQGIYESLRSFRSEVLEMMLMAPALYFMLMKRRPVVTAFLFSMIFLTHPSLWVITGICMLYVFFGVKWKVKVAVAIVFSVPIVAFLWYANVLNDFALLKEQLLDHGDEHMAKGNLLIDHFFTRYWPYYKMQPWVPLLNMAITAYCLYLFIKEKSIKNYPLELAFIANSVYWLFVLAPLYRYNIPNILLIFILLPKAIQYFQCRFNFKINYKYLAIGFLLLSPLIVLPFASRNVIAFAQREERNPYLVYKWLDTNLDSSKKILLVENSIGHYYKLQHPNIDFALRYSVYKYKFNDYDEVYLLTVDDEYDGVFEAKSWYSAGKERATLFGRQIDPNVITYYGLKLFKIENQESLMDLQKGYEKYAFPHGRN